MRIKNILISQPEPQDNKSPLIELADKYNLKLTFKKFIRVDQVPAMEFLKERIRILDHTAIIMTSRTAIENFFRICKETRVEVPANMKFFCISEAFALYLQKFTTYRKRKIFFPKTKDKSIKDIILKHKDERFFFPCSNISNSDIPEFMDTQKIPYTTGILYKTVSEDLKDIDINAFDIVAFFSPAGITSLNDNFPKFKQGEIKIASFGENTARAVTDSGFSLDIEAPTPQAPSMKMALEQFIKNFNK